MSMPSRAELTAHTVRAIAVHQHVSKDAARRIGQELLQSTKGLDLIERYIKEDLVNATISGHRDDASYWRAVLEYFRLARRHA
jgi:hypothetical protein